MTLPNKTWPQPPTDNGVSDWARRLYNALNEYSSAIATYVGHITARAIIFNHAASFSVSSEETQGGCITNIGSTGSVTATLPHATPGMVVIFYVKAAHAYVVTPAGGEQIMILTAAVNKTLTSDTTPGTQMTLVCFVAGTWDPTSSSGTWTSS